MMHSDSDQPLESVAHTVNGCNTCQGHYTAGHDRIDDLNATAVREVVPKDVTMYKHARLV